MKIAALFAGIAGLELGLHRAGHRTIMFCEIDPGARAVLRKHFPDVPCHNDIRDLKKLPSETEIVSAGFPCQDLSQAGSTNGIEGPKSSVVQHLFRLLRRKRVPNVLIENVPFMLRLHRGRAMKYLIDHLEGLGYKWAYRVVDSRCFGIPQRRERVFLIASKSAEPWHVLFKGNKQPRIPEYRPGIACGFYWTEGTRGLGWAVDAIPTLKGGSTIGIPSPPAIWMPDDRIVRPTIADAERFQGFPRDWTKPAEESVRSSYRWKLVGNAVSVLAARWIGSCLSRMHTSKPTTLQEGKLQPDQGWPYAAYGSSKLGRHSVEISTWPCARAGPSLNEFLSRETPDLSVKATKGFVERLAASNLKYRPEFLAALVAHQERLEAAEQ